MGASGQLPRLLPGTTRVPWPILLLVHTFFQMEGGNSELMEFTVSTLKAFFKACSQSGSGNKQELIACAIGCPKMLFFFFPHTRNLLAGQPGNYAKTLLLFFIPILHHLSPVIHANATVVATVVLRNSRFRFHCYTQREPTPTQKSVRI